MKIINIIYQFTVVLFQIWFLIIVESLRYIKILKNVERIHFDTVIEDKIDKLAKSTNLKRDPLKGYLMLFGTLPFILITTQILLTFGFIAWLISLAILIWIARKLS